MKNSKVKLKEFNTCSPNCILSKLFDFRDYVQPVDLLQDYWNNKTDTLILKVPMDNAEKAISAIVAMANYCHSDIEVRFINNNAIIRLWWD